MPKKTFECETLDTAIPTIFDQVQQSAANHRKNCTTLHKLFLQAASIRQPAKDRRALKLVGEKRFYDVFVDMIARVLAVKKGCVAADRVIKFVGSYVQFALQKGMLYPILSNHVGPSAK